MPGEWRNNTSKEYRGHRLSFVLAQAVRDYASYELVDCVDGDFSKLPPLQELVRWSYRPGGDEPRLQVLAKPGAKEKFNNNLWPGWWSSDTLFREYGEALLSECEARAAKEGAAFIDCVDGDFSKLPTVPVKPEPEEEEIPFEDDDDTEDDDGHGDDED